MNKSGNKILLFKILSIGLPVFIIVLLLEIILRFVGPKYYRFNNRSSEYYTNPRGYHLPIRKDGRHTIYSLKYYGNNLGYRIPPNFSLKEDVINKRKANLVLGIGDSFTFGRGVKYNDIYLTALEKSLNKNGYDLGIKNCAVVGYDLEDIFETYKYESSQRKYPLVIYGFVLNDFGLPGKEKIVGNAFIDLNNGNYSFDPIRKVSKLYNFIWYVIEKRRLHNTTLKAYLNAFKGEYANKGFMILKSLNQKIKENEGELVIVLFPLLYNFDNYLFKDVHKEMNAFCEKEGIFLLDLFPAFSKYKAKDLWVNPTDFHPNEIAHRIVSEELYKFLKEEKLLGKINL